MRLLIVAATAAEITPFLAAVTPLEPIRPRLSRGRHTGREIDVVITGVGMVPTAAWVARIVALAPLFRSGWTLFGRLVQI